MMYLTIAVGLLFGYWGVSAILDHWGGHKPSSSKKQAGSISLDKDRSWYEVLGISRSASLDEIVQAYRNAISQYHPDKVAHLGPELRDLAEKKSREINLAYEAALRERGQSS